LRKRGCPLEGSCQEVKRPPYKPFDIFFAEVCCMASHPYLAVSDASVFSTVRVSIANQRRTRHPSGSRLVMAIWPLGQIAGPWHGCAPENPRLPYACPTVRITDQGVAPWLHPYAGSRQRRHQLNKSVGGPVWWAEARTNQIS